MVDFAAPLTATEFGPEQQARLEAQYRTTAYQPLNAVFFESFFGQSASCNPLAIDRALAAAAPRHRPVLERRRRLGERARGRHRAPRRQRGVVAHPRAARACS